MKPALDPFIRVYNILQPVTQDLPDDTPLREVLPGAWPTLGDLRKLVKAPSVGTGTRRD